VSAQPEVEAAKKSPLLRYGVGLVIELADSGSSLAMRAFVVKPAFKSSIQMAAPLGYLPMKP
jgi:hypothetical protein